MAKKFATLGEDAGETTPASPRPKTPRGGGRSKLSLPRGKGQWSLGDGHYWLGIAILPVVWLFATGVAMMTTGVSNSGLVKGLVMVPNVNYLHLTAWLGTKLALVAGTSKIMMAIMLFLSFILKLVIMIVATVWGSLIHAGFGHWLANVILWFLAAAGLAYNRWSAEHVLLSWAKVQVSVNLLVWVIVGVLGTLLVHLKPQSQSWLAQLMASHVPIVGASVGLYGLVGILVVSSWTNRKDLAFSRWLAVIGLVVIVALVFTQVHAMGNPGATMLRLDHGAVAKLVAWLHLFGLAGGLLVGWRSRYSNNVPSGLMQGYHIG